VLLGIFKVRMVLMDDTNCTSVTGWDESSTATSVTYTNYYKDDWEYEPDYIAEEIEAVRFGWHNPRKVNLPVVNFKPRIQLQIRNQLPYKMREG